MQQFVFSFFFLIQDNRAVQCIEIQINPLKNIIVCQTTHGDQAKRILEYIELAC